MGCHASKKLELEQQLFELQTQSSRDQTEFEKLQHTYDQCAAEHQQKTRQIHVLNTNVVVLEANLAASRAIRAALEGQACASARVAQCNATRPQTDVCPECVTTRRDLQTSRATVSRLQTTHNDMTTQQAAAKKRHARLKHAYRALLRRCVHQQDIDTLVRRVCVRDTPNYELIRYRKFATVLLRALATSEIPQLHGTPKKLQSSTTQTPVAHNTSNVPKWLSAWL